MALSGSEATRWNYITCWIRSLGTVGRKLEGPGSGRCLWCIDLWTLKFAFECGSWGERRTGFSWGSRWSLLSFLSAALPQLIGSIACYLEDLSRHFFRIGALYFVLPQSSGLASLYDSSSWGFHPSLIPYTQTSQVGAKARWTKGSAYGWYIRQPPSSWYYS